LARRGFFGNLASPSVNSEIQQLEATIKQNEEGLIRMRMLLNQLKVMQERQKSCGSNGAKKESSSPRRGKIITLPERSQTAAQ